MMKDMTNVAIINNGEKKKKKDWRTEDIDSKVMILVRKDGMRMDANTDDKKILEIELRKKYGLQWGSI